MSVAFSPTNSPKISSNILAVVCLSRVSSDETKSYNINPINEEFISPISIPFCNESRYLISDFLSFGSFILKFWQMFSENELANFL